jgi:hypothetical protein
MAQLKKADLIKILVEEYGYEKEDIKMLTNGKLQAIIKQEEADAKALEEAPSVFVVEQKIKDDEQIVVMNGLSGSLTHRSGRTGRSWRFKEFGQTDKLPYEELLALKNGSPKVFEQGWIIILDKRVQEQFGLTELYKNILTPENIEQVFKKDVEELKEFVSNLPEGMKSTFVSKARELYEAKKLYDMRIIEYVETEFGFSLKDNAPLTDIVYKR